MSNQHGYLILMMAIAFMITNLFGAAFTISRVRSKRTQEMGQPSARASAGLAASGSLGRSETAIKIGRMGTGAFGNLAVAVAIFLAIGFLGLGVAVLRLW